MLGPNPILAAQASKPATPSQVAFDFLFMKQHLYAMRPDLLHALVTPNKAISNKALEPHVYAHELKEAFSKFIRKDLWYLSKDDKAAYFAKILAALTNTTRYQRPEYQDDLKFLLETAIAYAQQDLIKILVNRYHVKLDPDTIYKAIRNNNFNFLTFRDPDSRLNIETMLFLITQACSNINIDLALEILPTFLSHLDIQERKADEKIIWLLNTARSFPAADQKRVIDKLEVLDRFSPPNSDHWIYRNMLGVASCFGCVDVVKTILNFCQKTENAQPLAAFEMALQGCVWSVFTAKKEGKSETAIQEIIDRYQQTCEPILAMYPEQRDQVRQLDIRRLRRNETRYWKLTPEGVAELNNIVNEINHCLIPWAGPALQDVMPFSGSAHEVDDSNWIYSIQ